MQHRRAIALRSALIATLLLTAACGDDEEDNSASNNSTANNSAANNNPANNNPANNNPANNNPANNNPANNNPANNNPANNNPVDPAVSQCGGFEPGITLPDEREATCATCVDEACCDEAAACGDDADCLALRQCYTACADFDDACAEACAEAYPDSDATLNSAFVTCRNTSCAAECRREGNWTCLEAPLVLEAFTEATRTFTVYLEDFQTRMPVAGATLRACANEDTACETPLMEGVTDANGAIEVTVPVSPDGFMGYYEITGAGRYPGLFVENPPIQSAETSFLTLSEASFNGFVALMGITADPTRGHVAIQGADCGRRAAAELVFSSSRDDDTSRVGYIAGSLPSPNATATDASGVGGIFNLTPDPAVTLTGTLVDGRVVGSHTIPVRAGWITTTNVVPDYTVE